MRDLSIETTTDGSNGSEQHPATLDRRSFIRGATVVGAAIVGSAALVPSAEGEALLPTTAKEAERGRVHGGGRNRARVRGPYGSRHRQRHHAARRRRPRVERGALLRHIRGRHLREADDGLVRWLDGHRLSPNLMHRRPYLISG